MAEKDPVKYFKTEIKRPNYYNSQFLVDTDFNDEQLYHKQMRRFHNRSLHTWGIVEGLNVERVAGQNQVTVSPGTAVDRLGQEIVLPERSGAIGFDKFDAGAQVYVMLKYADVTDPSDKSDSQGEGGRYKRWTERPEVYPAPAEPAADAPDVVLAVVTLDKDKAIADVSPSRRRYAGSRFGSSGDGKEFSIYADAAGAWHFFDGGKGADRLTVDEKGTLKITGGDLQFDAGREIFFQDNGQIRSRDDNHRILFRRSENKLELREFGDIIFSPGANGGAETAKVVMSGGGNVGVGTATPPSQKLQVSGTIYSDSGGFMFPDGTTQATSAGTAKIPAENVAAGSFGGNTGGGAYTFPAQLYWGNSAARTETKDDAGAIASKSGFFETSAPTNYYAGASSWQHLIESRHSNNGNNYALQIAGSFYDQKLYMRKTNHDPAAKWSQFVLMNSDGNVGIGIATTPAVKLDVGEGGVFIRHGRVGTGLEVGSRDTATTNTPNGRIGFPGFGVQHGQIRWVPASDRAGRFEFVDSSSGAPSGDYGAAPNNVGIRAGRGYFTDNVGIGTANPLGPLSVGDSSVAGSDGYIVVGKKTPAGGTRHARIGYDATFNFAIGDYGNNNAAGTWTPQLAINWQAPANSLLIDSGGNVTMKGNSLTIGNWTIVSDGDHLYFKRGDKTIVRFSATWDRLMVFKDLNGTRPYFYYNQNGAYGNYTG